MWFIALIIVFFCYAFWRKKHHQYIQLRFKYKVYALRDRLRKMAANGEIDPGNWLFDFFDGTFSKAISESYWLTFFHIILLSVVYYQNQSLFNFKMHLEDDLEKNPKLNEIRDEYVEILSDYVASQHFGTIKVVGGFLTLTALGNRLRIFLQSIVIYPETSSSQKYMDQPMIRTL